MIKTFVNDYDKHPETLRQNQLLPNNFLSRNKICLWKVCPNICRTKYYITISYKLQCCTKRNKPPQNRNKPWANLSPTLPPPPQTEQKHKTRSYLNWVPDTSTNHILSKTTHMKHINFLVTLGWSLTITKNYSTWGINDDRQLQVINNITYKITPPPPPKKKIDW